jgi:hypothetical protein
MLSVDDVIDDGADGLAGDVIKLSGVEAVGPVGDCSTISKMRLRWTTPDAAAAAAPSDADNSASASALASPFSSPVAFPAPSLSDAAESAGICS